MIAEFQNTLAGSRWRRRAERNKRAADEDFDAEEHEALKEEQAAEDEVFDQPAECVGSLLRSLHAPVLPALEPLLQEFVAPMLAPIDPRRSDASPSASSMTSWNTRAGTAAEPQIPLVALVGPCLAGCRDADADVRQASVYGVGVMAQALGAAFTPHVPARPASGGAVGEGRRARARATLE